MVVTVVLGCGHEGGFGDWILVLGEREREREREREVLGLEKLNDYYYFF